MTVNAIASSKRRPPPKRKNWNLNGILHNTGFRNLLAQVIVVGTIIGLAVYMFGNAQSAMEKRGIQTGFAFLFEEAGFAIGESIIPFESTDTFLRAYGVAVLNTLKVSILSVIAATVIGVTLGIARLSTNAFIAKLSSAYVELFRNTPQLVQMVFWYVLLTQLPLPKQAFNFFDLAYLSNRGLIVSWPADNPVYAWMLAAFVAACVGAWLIIRWAEAQRRRTGHAVHVLGWNIGLIIALPLFVWLLGGQPTEFSVPELRGFNFQGGAALSPEFLALLLGLSLYIAAFIAEIVRSGIQSVSKGQIEAATSISLNKFDLYLEVILPQALRVIIPPAAAQYVSLVKTSSLGVVIGYPELFNVNNTIITLSGNTIEAIGIMMAIYLTIAFTIAAIMNAYNKAVQIKER